MRSDLRIVFVRRIVSYDGDLTWDGIEIRLLRLLADRLNFTINIREAGADDSSK